MKYLLALFFLSFSLMASEDLVRDLKKLEKKHNVVIQSMKAKKVSDTDKLVKIYRDSEDDLKDTNEKNFFLKEESVQIKLIKGQMEKSGGSRVGNGGDVVYCEKDGSMEVLDSFRARRMNSEKFSIVESENYQDSISKILEKFSKSLPLLKEQLGTFYKQYSSRESFSEVIFWSPEDELINIKDEQLMAKLPKGCSLVQAVVRLKTKRKVFFYNTQVFNKIRSQDIQLSWMLVHEWLWDYLDSSSDVRDVNHYLHSDTFQNAHEEEVLEHLKKFGFKLEERLLYSKIVERDEQTFDSLTKIDSLIEELDSMDKDSKEEERQLAHEQFYIKMSRELSNSEIEKKHFGKLELKVEETFRNLKRFYSARLKELRATKNHKLEQGYLARVQELFNNDGLTRDHKFYFLSATHSTNQIQELSERAIAKIYIQKKAWFITRGNADKAMAKVSVLDDKVEHREISLSTYFILLFKAMKVKMPNKYKHL